VYGGVLATGHRVYGYLKIAVLTYVVLVASTLHIWLRNFFLSFFTDCFNNFKNLKTILVYYFEDLKTRKKEV